MWTHLKVITKIVILVCIFGGGYLAFRYYQSSSMVLEQYIHAQQSVAPTRCVLPGASSFSVTVQDLVISIDGRNLRADWTQFELGRSAKIHAVSNDNGMHYYVWSDDSNNSLIFSKEQFVAGENNNSGIFTHMEGTCNPWWFSDTSLFVIPDNMTFVPYSG